MTFQCKICKMLNKSFRQETSLNGYLSFLALPKWHNNLRRTEKHSYNIKIRHLGPYSILNITCRVARWLWGQNILKCVQIYTGKEACDSGRAISELRASEVGLLPEMMSLMFLIPHTSEGFHLFKLCSEVTDCEFWKVPAQVELSRTQWSVLTQRQLISNWCINSCFR